jgi:hypothetical protein
MPTFGSHASGRGPHAAMDLKTQCCWAHAALNVLLRRDQAGSAASEETKVWLPHLVEDKPR